MNIKTVLLLLIALVLVVTLLTYSIINNKTSHKIVKVLKKEGILKQSTKELIIDYGEPKVYNATIESNYIYIYEFDSLFDRNRFEGGLRKHLERIHMPDSMGICYKIYISSNVVLIYFFKYPKLDAEMSKINNAIIKLDNIFFNILNKGIKKIYPVKGKNWSGTYKEEYYDNKIKNKAGYIEDDVFYKGDITVQYIGNRRKNERVKLDIFIPSYRDLHMSSERDGDVVSCNFQSYTKIVKDKEDIEITVSWDNKKETLKLEN